MRPATAWATAAFLVAATGFGLSFGHPWIVAQLAAAIVVMRRRWGFAAAAALGVGFNAFLFALLLPGPGWSPAPLAGVGIALSSQGALTGFWGGVRLAAVAGANLAILSRLSPEAVLDGLRLPHAATAFLAAVLASTHDLGREWVRLVDARRLDGAWPGGWRRVPAAAGLLPALLVVAVRQAHVRREALRLAGYDTAPAFAALVAVTALAAAGRMAMLAVPNDPVTYAVVFLGGVLFGSRIGALAGLLAMAITNLLLSGLHPAAFANAPAMALLGLFGGVVGRLRLVRGDGASVAVLAAACGAIGVLAFSVTADALTWLIVPEYRGDLATLRVLVAAGLAFNVLPAVAAAMVFALAVGPVARAADAAGLHPPSRGPAVSPGHARQRRA